MTTAMGLGRALTANLAAGASAELQRQREQSQPADERAVQTYPDVPPVRCASNPNHPDFHPSCFRIGVIVNGKPRDDITFYDAAAGSFRCNPNWDTLHQGHQVVVFWKWTESRQERRQRERWDQAHGYDGAAHG